MGRRGWVALAVTVVALGAGALLDLAPLVPIKAAVINIIPIGGTARASAIDQLCRRAYLSNARAASACYDTYTPQDAKDERVADLQSNAAQRQMCSHVEAIFAKGVPTGLLESKPDQWTLIGHSSYAEPYLNEMASEGYTIIFDRAAHTISGAKMPAMDTYFSVDCKEFA